MRRNQLRLLPFQQPYLGLQQRLAAFHVLDLAFQLNVLEGKIPHFAFQPPDGVGQLQMKGFKQGVALGDGNRVQYAEGFES